VTKLFAIIVSIGLVACSGKKKDEEGKEPPAGTLPVAPAQASPPSTGSPASPGSAATGSAAAVPAEAPAGSASAAPGTTPVGPTGTAGGPGATTPTPVGCASPSPLHCDAGQADGCTGGLTSVHVCVASDAKAGSPCAQGAAPTCPTGQIDACGFTPPYASNHVCVVVPKPTP
jgi:DNA polymerase-3 subunit gamma/tau